MVQIDLVAPAGQNRWLIGCPHLGDPRREDGCLRGEVISAAHEDKQTPLCGLSAIDQRAPVACRLTVGAHREYFRLTDDADCEQLITDDFLSFERINAGTLIRRARAERGLRSRIAGLAGIKATLPPDTDRGKTLLSLLTRTMIFHPAPDADG